MKPTRIFDARDETRALVEQVTPERARALLAAGDKTFTNRSFRPRLAATYTRLMSAGRWGMLYDPIRIDERGNVIDGQHRLFAIIKSGVTLPMLIVSGLPSEAAGMIDQGARRTGGDMVKMRGIACANCVASAIAFVWRYLTNQSMLTCAPAPAEVLVLLDEYAGIERSAHFIQTTVRHITGTLGGAAGCHWLFSQVDDAQSAEFWEQVASGADLSIHSPTLALRNRIMETRARPNRGRNDVPLAAQMIKAWNAYRGGLPIKHLRFSSSEAFPTIAGLDVAKLRK